MLVLVMPDAHLHTKLFDVMDDVLDSHPAIELVLSLGDWADDWNKPASAYKEFFERFEKFMRDHEPRQDFDFCWGNHDYAYQYFPGKCSGYVPEATEIVRDFIKTCPTPRFAIKIDNVIFSHAGVTPNLYRSYRMVGHDYPDVPFLEWISRQTPNRLWQEDSPLWHRPSNNLHKNNFNKRFLQVVGHTPVPTITHNIDDNIIYTDTWSTDSSGEALGDCSLLVIDTNTLEFEKILVNQKGKNGRVKK